MTRRAYWTISLVLCALPTAAACGGSTAQLQTARAASYDGDRDAVFRELVTAISIDYGKGLEVDDAGLVIKTAWHALRVRDSATNRDENAAASGGVPTGVSQGAEGGSISGPAVQDPRAPESAPAKMSFVRFDVRLVGGPPWRVEVAGFASEFDHTTGKPMPLKGAERPYWLDGRQEKLEVAIYERLRKFEHKPAK